MLEALDTVRVVGSLTHSLLIAFVLRRQECCLIIHPLSVDCICPEETRVLSDHSPTLCCQDSVVRTNAVKREWVNDQTTLSSPQDKCSQQRVGE